MEKYNSGHPDEGLEIRLNLDLSTAHLREEDAGYLDRKAACDYPLKEEPAEFLIVYRKGEFGYFVYIIDEYQDQLREEIEPLKEAYPPLADAVQFAVSHNCSMICFDRDAGIVSQLRTYEW